MCRNDTDMEVFLQEDADRAKEAYDRAHALVESLTNDGAESD